MSAERESSFNWRNRMVIDFPELFTTDAIEFIRKSRLEFPVEFPAFAPRLRELGAKISLITDVQRTSAGKLEVEYRFAIDIPGEESQRITVRLVDAESPMVGVGREYAVARAENIEFRRQFGEQLAELRFGEVVQMAYEKTFPERECKHALTATVPEISDALSAVVH